MRSATASANPLHRGRLGRAAALPSPGNSGVTTVRSADELREHPRPEAGVEGEGVEQYQRGRLGHRVDATVSA